VDHADLDQAVTDLTAASERLDELADTADLMGDEPGAARLRAAAASRRTAAMSLLDQAQEHDHPDQGPAAPG